MVRPDIVGIVGLSQGGHIAPLVANLCDEIAYVVDVSGSATTPVEQVDHEMRNTFRQAGLSNEDVERGMELQRLAGEYIRTGDWEPYEAALEAAKDTPIASIAADFPQSPQSWVWAWWRRIADFDPLREWERLDIPSLVIYGERDDEDNTPVTESVRRLQSIEDSHPNLEVLVIKGSGHAIYAPESTSLHPDAINRIETLISSLN